MIKKLLIILFIFLCIGCSKNNSNNDEFIAIALKHKLNFGYCSCSAINCHNKGV